MLAAQRATKSYACRQRVVVTGADLQTTAMCCGRLRALHVHESGQRVCPIARALGASQYINLLHVEQGCDCADAAEVDVVDQEADGRVRRALVLFKFADSANLQIAGAMAIARPIDVRQGINQFFEMLYRLLLNRLLIENAD